MASSSVGGLYVTVNIDTQKAVKDLQNFKSEMGKAFTGSANANVAQANDSLSDTAVKAVVAASALKNLSGVTKTAGASFAKLGQTAALASGGGMSRLGTVAAGASASFSGIAATGAAAATGIGLILAAAVAATAAVAALTAVTVKLGNAGFNTAKELELLELSLTAILGSEQEALSEIAALQDIARESPFLTPTVIAMDKFLLSQGLVSAEIRGNLIPAVLDMAAAFGLSSDNLGSISYALAQVQSRGYLSGDELRQLANQLVPVWKILREIPELAEKSQTELRKMSEQGLISSEDFFIALTNYSEQYAETAKLAALTTQGLLTNIQDIININVGQAFRDIDNADIEGLISPLEAVKNILLAVTQLAKDIDFAPFAAALGQLVNVFTGPIATFLGDQGAGITAFFEEWLPSAILTTAKALTFVSEIVQIFTGVMYEVFKTLVGGWVETTQAVGQAASGWANVWAGIAEIVAIAAGAIIGIMQLIAAVVRSVIALLTGNMEAANNASIDAFAAVAKGAEVAANTYDRLIGVLARMNAMQIPDISGLGATAGFGDDTDPFAGLGQGTDGGGGGGGTSAALSEINKAMDVLWDLTRRWQGLRSDLEKGFLGPDGFSATIDQIIAMGQKVSDALLTIGATEAANAVIAGTFQLIELAERRTELTDQLAEAERSLNDLLKQREQFVVNIRKSAIDFAAALKLEEETTKVWELQSARGFFIETETKQTKDFADSLRDRALALKEFFANIQLLRERGIDENFLQELMLAGPEAAGEVAAALAAGGQEMIDEVNVLYEDIQATADALAEYGAEAFYDSGIEQAEGLVTGIESELESVTSAAESLGEAMYQATLPWAKQMEDAGAAAGGAAGAGLAAGGAGIGGIAGGITADALSPFEAMSEPMGIFGGESIESFIEEFENPFADFLESAQGFADQVEGIFQGVEDFFGNLDFTIDGVVDIAYNLYKSFWGAVADLLGSIGGNILDLIGLRGAWNWLKQRAGGYGNPLTPGASFSGTSANQSFSSSTYTGGYLPPSVNSVGAVGVSQYSSASIDGYVSGSGYGATMPNGGPVIKVYIGDRELTDIVRTEVVFEDNLDASRVITGRRV